MIIGICGTHGTGKSTIMQAAKDAGYYVSEEQLSRTAQKMLGWNRLSIAQESVDNMWALQDAVLQAMYDRDQRIIKSGKLTVVERTPADAWAYTAWWCSKHGLDVRGRFIQDKRAEVYKGMCRDLAREYAKFVIVPPAPQIPFEEDPNRADIQSRSFVENEINQFIWDGNLPCYVITTAAKQSRAAEIECVYTLTQAEIIAKAKLKGIRDAEKD